MYFATTDTGMYQLKLESGTGSNGGQIDLRFGPYEQCSTTCVTVNGVKTCADAICTGIGLETNCSSTAESREKFFASQVSMIAAGALQLGVLFTIFGNGAGLALARIVISLFGFLAYGLTGAFTALFFYYWVACSEQICDDGNIDPSLSCSQNWTWPWWLIVGAGGLSLIGFILAIVAKGGAVPEGAAPADDAGAQEEGNGDRSQAYQAYDQDQQEGGADNAADQQQNGDDGNANEEDGNADDQEPTKRESYEAGNNANANGQQHDEEDDDLYPVPEGDWYYDEDSQMHWSDEQWMYFHRESGQFYDPEADMWYSDEVGDWYKAEDYEEEEEAEGGAGGY